MPITGSLPEIYKIVQALQPAADAAGRTGTYISLKHAHRVFIVVNIDQGNAATVALSLSQATAVAGTGAKAVANAVPIWANQDTATNDTAARQTDAASFTPSAAVKRKVVIFQVDAAALDLANGYKCIAVVTGASNAANITSAMFFAVPRYKQANPPSILLD